MLLISHHALRQTIFTDREVALRIHVPLCRTLPVQLDGPLIALVASSAVSIATPCFELRNTIPLLRRLLVVHKGEAVVFRNTPGSIPDAQIPDTRLRPHVPLIRGLPDPVSYTHLTLPTKA